MAFGISDQFCELVLQREPRQAKHPSHGFPWCSQQIRDEKTSRLVSGQADRNLFNDVESINGYLDESAATVALFKKIETAQPDFAASVYDLADQALIAAGEYALAKRYGRPRDPV